jgi:hypothetical protein
VFYVIVFKHSFLILWISFALFQNLRRKGKEQGKIPGKNRVQRTKKTGCIPSTVFFPAIFSFLRDRAERRGIGTPPGIILHFI